MKPRNEWAQEFIGWLRRPHKDDYMVWSDEEDEEEDEEEDDEDEEEDEDSE